MSVAIQARPKARLHLKINGGSPARGLERCEDDGCLVASDGIATSCGRLACPSCGCGGTNLSTIQLVNVRVGTRIDCTCGNSWVHFGRADAGSPVRGL
jgi:hypothetical protein